MRALPRNTVLVGDAAERLRELPDASVDMVLTSPPYFRLRDYQVDGQLGLESNVAEWVDGLREVTREVSRLLVPGGTLWLNLGDSYSTHTQQGAPRKSLLLGPERLVLGLLQDDWLLRNKIVWAKTNPMPSSVSDRFSTTWEIVYLLARQRDYYFDLDAVRQPHTSRAKPPKQPPRESMPTPGGGRTPTVPAASVPSRRPASSAIRSARTPATFGPSPPPATGAPTSRPSPEPWRTRPSGPAARKPDAHYAGRRGGAGRCAHWAARPPAAPSAPAAPATGHANRDLCLTRLLARAPLPSPPRRWAATGSASSLTRPLRPWPAGGPPTPAGE